MSEKLQTRANDKRSSLKPAHRTVPQEHHPLTWQTHPTIIIQRAKRNPDLLTPRDILQLQRTIGNRALGRLLGARGQQLAAGRSMPSQASQPIQRLIGGDAFAQESVGTGKVSQPDPFFSKVVTRLKEYHGKLKSAGLRSKLGHLTNLLHEVQEWVKGAGQGNKRQDKVKKLESELIDEIHSVVVDRLPDFKFSEHFKKEGEEKFKDAWKGGALNQVDWIFYKFGIRRTGKGFEKVKLKPKEKGFQGVFKAMQTHEELSHLGTQMGIPKKDPGFHLRTLAMYKLDQLLGANVIPPTFLAKHSGKLGTVMEKVKGLSVNAALKKIGNLSAKIMNITGQYMGSKMDEADEKQVEQLKRQRDEVEKVTKSIAFRRTYSILTLLDTIAGQVDRHDKNYIVEMESGVAKGVKGIDNDLAFGIKYDKAKLEQYFKKGMQPVLKGGKPVVEKGKTVMEVAGKIPSQLNEIDHEFAKKIIEMAESNQQQVREALKGLLSEGEIEATIGRLTALAEWLKPLLEKKDGLIVTKWK